MTNHEEEKIQLSQDFIMPDPEISNHLHISKDIILDFVGKEGNFWSSLHQVGPPKIQKNPKTIADWTLSISSGWDSASFDLSSDDNQRVIYFDINFLDRKFKIQVDVIDNAQNIDNAKNTLNKIAQVLNLKPEPEVNFRRRNKFIGLERIYQLEKPKNSDWFDRAIIKLESGLGQITSFHGNFSIMSPTQDQHERKDLESWKKDISVRWNEITQLYCWLDGYDYQIYFNTDFQRNEIRIKVEAETEQIAANFLHELEQELALEASTDVNGRRDLTGFERQYFTNDRINPIWFDSAATLIQSYAGIKVYFTGDFRLLSKPRQTETANDIGRWKSEITDQWPGIIWIYCYISGSTEIAFDCDPRRELVTLRIKANSEEEVEEIFRDFLSKLKLEPIQESLWSVRSKGDFKFGSWTRTSFANAIEHTIKQFFRERPPVIIQDQTFFIEEEEEINEPPDLTSFLTRAKEDKVYTEAHLVMEGTRGNAMGIHLYASSKRLELRSSLSRERFLELTRVFDDFLGGLTEIEDIESEEKEDKKDKGFGESLWVKVALPIVTLILGASILSPVFWNAIIPKYTLQITVPPSKEDNADTLTTREIPIEWILETEQFFQSDINRNSTATIRVLEDGYRLIHNLVGKTPGDTIQLDNGMFDIEVISSQAQVSDKIRVVIKANP